MKKIVFGLLFFSLAGCMKNASDCNLTNNFCACDRTTASTNPDCRDYEDMSADSAKSKCNTDGGTFSTTGLCPTADRLGTCKFTSGTEITHQRYYAASVGTAAAGAVVCAYYKANCFVLSGNALCDAVWTTP